MLRGDASGRVPFALVAVLLLMSSALGAVYSAQLAREEGERRAHEAQLAALGRIADQVRGEVLAQALYIAIGAIAQGTDGYVNESRVAEVFRAGLADYLARAFPRTVRGITVEVTEAPLDVRLLERQMVDIAPSNRTVRETVEGVEIETPDPSAPDEWLTVERYAYFEVHGVVNSTLRLERTELRRSQPVASRVPVPAPLMEAKLEQATRRGAGDLAGVGHTVKAIIASLVQYRLLNGYASSVVEDSTARDILGEDDVALAVNFAIVLEEVRLFRTFDRDAAASLDEALGALPGVPEGLAPPAGERTLAQLLDRYASEGTLDAVDLYALWRRFDVDGVSVESVFAQAIAAVQDQVVLKMMDYLGLTPLVDFLAGIAEWLAQTWDDFVGWVTGSGGRKVEQMHQYINEIFSHAGESTRFASPLALPVSARSYTVSNGSADVTITVPAHDAAAKFWERDLVSGEYNAFWETYFDRFMPKLKAVHEGLRDFANDVASNVARIAVESGLLPRRVSAPIDPKDGTSWSEALTREVASAVDAAMEQLRADPTRILELTEGLWASYVALLQDMMGHLAAHYDDLATESGVDQVAWGRIWIRAAIGSHAQDDPDYGFLGPIGEMNLGVRIEEDVLENRLGEAAWDARRTEDLARWRHVEEVLTGTGLPGDPAIRRQLVDAVLGAGGWLVLARTTIDRFLDEVVRAQDVAALRAAYPVRLDAFDVWDPRNPADRRMERFRVIHAPLVLRPGIADPSSLQEGDLWVRVVDPSEWSPEHEKTPNVHYTKAGETSYRPFVTGWGVRVLGAVRLRVETEDRPLLDSTGAGPFGVEKVWPLEFSFSVQGYSGWSLEGVAYQSSNTLWGDAWNAILDFLEWVWDRLVSLGKWILDLLGKAVKFLMDLLEPLLAFAEKVVKVLSDLLGKLADLLYDLLVTVADFVGGIVDAVAELFPANTSFTITLYGFTFGIRVNGDDGTEVEVVVDTPAFDVAFAVVDLEERGVPRGDGPRYDLTAEWDVSVGPFALEAAFDPFAAVFPEIVSGSASWRGSWAIDLTGLEIEPTVQARLAVGFTVLTPLGLADVEVGLYASFTEDPVSFWDLVERSLREALEELGSGDVSWDALGPFARTFANRLAANLVAEADGLVEAGLYVEVVWKPGVAVGIGFRLSFVAAGAAMIEILRWVVHNVLTFFERMLDPSAPADYQGLAPGVPELLYVRFEGFFVVELPKVAAYMGLSGIPSGHLAGMIEANAPAFGALFGQNWGRWEVGFGVYVDLVIPLRSLPFGSVDATTTVWLLRGTLHAY